MINGNVNEFVNNLYYGSEMYFTFYKQKYFIQGWYVEPFYYLVLDQDFEETEIPKDYTFQSYIWEYKAKDPGECVQAFLDTPLWNGKTFYEVEKEITWTF